MQRLAALFPLCLICISLPTASAGRSHTQPATHHSTLLTRRYIEGEKLVYHMLGNNNGWRYEIQANGVVKKGEQGRYFVEYRWSDLSSNNQRVPLAPASLNFRQDLSLTPGYRLSIPNLTEVQPALIGPITDLLTFYADLQLAISQGLSRPDDHAYVKYGRPSSWADGRHVLLGESSIDFDLTLASIADRVATVVVRHVPPVNPGIKFPADWMWKPVASGPNNWVEMEKSGDRYKAEVGQETFYVELKVSTKNGEILSGTMDDLVELASRECEDAALSRCGSPARTRIHRAIKIELSPPISKV
jgi:hypothetical protein